MIDSHAEPAPFRDEPIAPCVSVSILMSTYAREKASNLDACLSSLARQTVLPGQIVLVVDGPIDAEQEAVLGRFADDQLRGRLTLVRLPENVGLANAMNAGLEVCTGLYTMRMDSDDLCQPDRVEVQLAYLGTHPEIDVVSSWCEEFGSEGSTPRLKVSAVTHEAVVQSLRWRNVLVHPTICVKTPILREIGGYSAKFDLLEDYDLFIRLAQHGARFHVIPKVLVRMRAGLEQARRRGGMRYALHELRFRFFHYRNGFLSFRQFLVITSLYTIFRLVSGGMRENLYALARR